jgi:flagellin-like hook-associated protein FlgL
MSDISLNSGIRSNLLSLQSSSKLFQRTTERLASGRKVNTAIDNPTNYFASINLTDRSAGLQARLDGMGQAVQQIKSADNGITTIRSFISAMKGVVNNALSNTSASSREALGKQFNELVVQISTVAKDSGYQGINLLERNETNTVQFNETFDASVLQVRGFNVQGPGSDGRGLVNSNGEVESAALTISVTQQSAAEITWSAFDGTGTAAGTISVAGGATGLIDTNGATGVGGSAAVPSTALRAFAVAVETQDDDTIVGIRGAKVGGGTGMIDWTSANYKTDLASLVNDIESFDEVLRTQASNLAQNLAAITIREDFSNQLINTLNEGSDKLVLADLNEEGANLLALQTSSQLATQSLSLASQQTQQILQLLG